MTDKPKNTTYSGVRDGWKRATFIVREDQYEKIKAVAYWDRRNIKEVIEEAFEAYLKGKRVKAISNKNSG